jgi:hypothetical protein
MKYKLNKINIHDAASGIKDILDLQSIINSPVLMLEDIVSLRLFSEICNDHYKDMIANIIYDVLVKENKKIFSNMIEKATLSAFYTFFNAITRMNHISKKGHRKVEEMVVEFFKYHSKGQVAYEDIYTLSLIHQYNKKFEINNPNITYYYLLSIVSTMDHPYHDKKYAQISQRDIEDFKFLIKDRDLNKQAMYERVIKNGIHSKSI